VHVLHELAHPVRIGRWKDPVAQIEDMGPPARNFVEHPTGLASEGLARPEKRSRVEIALERHPFTNTSADPAEGFSPVDTERVGSGTGEELEQVG